MFAGPPDPPSVVSVEVTSTSSIMVYFTESNNENSSMTTKFKGMHSHLGTVPLLVGKI